MKPPQKKIEPTQIPKIHIQQNLSIFHPKPSVYNIIRKNYETTTTLCIYDTESESKEKKILQTPEVLNEGTCITQLPNGKLFCYGNSYVSGITVLIDENCVVEVLPSGTPCCFSSAIYFNQSVYCFGGYDGNRLTLSRRFDLVQKRWRKLTPMPQPDNSCNSIIFNGNILISGYYNRKLLLYSIDIDSYSTIPYDFAEEKRKILINAERLYLIECRNGWIYESEIGSDTAWRQIAEQSTIYSAYQMYCAYNKGGVYIGCYYNSVDYYKFDLNAKRLINLGKA